MHYIVSKNKFVTFFSDECTENFEIVCTYE